MCMSESVCVRDCACVCVSGAIDGDRLLCLANHSLLLSKHTHHVWILSLLFLHSIAYLPVYLAHANTRARTHICTHIQRHAHTFENGFGENEEADREHDENGHEGDVACE